MSLLMAVAADSIEPGLTSSEAKERLLRYGPNQVEVRHVSAFRILSRQAAGSIFWLLFLAALVSLMLGDTVEAATMAFILLLNVLVGFAEEMHSEKALHKLCVATARRANVRRDGRTARLRASEIVPGDLLVLAPGNVVAADAVVRESRGLVLDEAELTGQTAPVAKSAVGRGEGAASSRVFAGTVVASGNGTAEVVATGLRSDLARVARLADHREQKTLLRQKLDRVGRALVAFCVVVVLVVAALELAHGAGIGQVLLASLSLAVASLPESLGAVVVIALTAVAKRLSSQGVLVRRLDAVETLGSTTLICFGKSGTLTTTELAVSEIRSADDPVLLDAALATAHTPASADAVQQAILRAAHDRHLGGENGVEITSLADADASTDGCVAAERAGVWYLRGAAETVLRRCRPGAPETSPDVRASKQDEYAVQVAEMQAKGLLVVAVARSRSSQGPFECVGLLGLSETARPDMKQSIAVAHEAGIRVVMMTGDHERQAQAVAKVVGLADPALDGAARTVIADATTEQKVDNVRRWKASGDVVLVTGERMNDAPAVAEADVGVAMGSPGSDVTVEAADVVLLDGRFSHLLTALREGRGVFLNIRKSLVYVLAGNLAELSIMLVASALGWPEPLLPLQLLWINLVTDSLPAFALALEPPEARVMRQPPRRPEEPLLRRTEWRRIVAMGALQTVAGLLAFRLAAIGDLSRGRALAVSTVVLQEIFWALALSSGRRPDGHGARPILFQVVVATVLVHCAVVMLPLHNMLARQLHLRPTDTAVALLLGLVPYASVRGRAALRGDGRRRSPPAPRPSPARNTLRI